MTKQPDDVTPDADDVLAGVDLEAWSPPALPDQGDAIVARMRVPGGVPASETVPLERHGRPRTWIAVGAGLAAIATATLVIASLREPAVSSVARAGELRAVRAEHVTIGASSGELDPGAQIQWRRDGTRVLVTQHQGRATWRVAAEDTFVIETRGGNHDAGAMVAAVEATGASLRVEVDMTAADTKLVGTGAITAAAIAVVTVMVYQGHVDVTGSGQTLRIAPGGTVEVTPGTPPKVQDMIAQNESLRQRAAELERQLASTKVELDRARADALVPEKLDDRLVLATMARLRDPLARCDDGSSGATLEVEVRVTAHGSVAFAEVSPPTSFDGCIVNVLQQTPFPRTQRGGVFAWPLATKRTSGIAAKPPAPTSCDAAALVEAGQAHTSRGEAAAALDKFHRAHECRAAANTANMAFLAACTSKNAPMAKRYYPLITLPSLAQRCREGSVAYE